MLACHGSCPKLSLILAVQAQRLKTYLGKSCSIATLGVCLGKGLSDCSAVAIGFCNGLQRMADA